MRGAAQEKMGYYPIPYEVICWIAAQFSIAEGVSLPLVDPCMGEGAALKTLAHTLRTSGAEPRVYGCEISRVRYCKAVESVLGGTRDGISRMLHGPAEFIEVSGGVFSLLYLNPPFDERGGEQERWLELTEGWVAPGGWLVFITTEESALRPTTQKLLDRSYESVRCYRYPDAYRQFKEVVVFARKRAGRKRDLLSAALYTVHSLTTLTLQERFGFTLPTAQPPKRFAMAIPDVAGSITAVQETGISTGEAWQRLVHTASLSGTWQPLLELSDGHIANLISSGAFDGLPIVDDELGRCLITGYGTREKTDPVVEADEDGISVKETVTEVAVVHLVVMNIDTGELHKFSSRDPGAMERFMLRHLHTLKAAISDTLRPVFDPATMLDPYLSYVPRFNAPGILPGATRLRLKNGERVRVKRKTVDGFVAANENGKDVDVQRTDVAHVYQNMLPAQLIKAAAMAYAMEHTTTSVIEVGQMGAGKTSTSMLTLYLYLARHIERAAASYDEHTRQLDTLYAELAAATDPKSMRSLHERIRQTERDREAAFKIVVVCPGHLVDKWAREATANFGNMTVHGKPVEVVIPGRVPRREENYTLSGNRVRCAECGTVASVKLSAQDMLKARTLADKLASMSTLTCSNPKCRHPLIATHADCPIEDIDDAFASPCMSILILSKEDAKLGATWEPAFIRKELPRRDELGRVERRADGKIATFAVVQCPECGALVQDRKGEYLLADEMADPERRKKHYCTGKVERVKRENGKVVTELRTFHEWRGGDFGIPRLVEVTREVPVTETVTCGAPLFRFTRLGSTGKRGGGAKPHNTYRTWSRGERVPNPGSARLELAKVIARQHRREYLLIIDEAHQFKAKDSIQGKAIGWLITSARRTIALTGTVFGGKSSSLFYLLYRLSSQFRESFGWHSVERFVDLYGVHEYVTKTTRTDADGIPSAYGAHVKTSTRTDEGNGVDPAIVRWLLSIGVFLTLDDLGIELPEKEERFHWISPEPEVLPGLAALDTIRREAAALAARGDFSLFSAWMQAALGWVLCPDIDETYLAPAHRKRVEKLIAEGRQEEARAYEAANTVVWAEAVPFTPERLESKIIREIADACSRDWQTDGDRSVVYVSGIKRPANKHLYHAMKRRGLKPFILTTPGDTEVVKWCEKGDYARCELDEREAVIATALVERDIHVLIVNPPLVATGLDLIAFNRLHFCGIPTYSVYTFEQSMCRLHRPGQQKRVYIDFWVYGENPTTCSPDRNSLQALGMAVMSDKVRASAVVSGSVGAALAALNGQTGDIMTTLRDVLLKGDSTGSLATEAVNVVDTAGRNLISNNPLYTHIEAEVERYDDMRVAECVGVVEFTMRLTDGVPSDTAPEVPFLSITGECTHTQDPLILFASADVDNLLAELPDLALPLRHKLSTPSKGRVIPITPISIPYSTFRQVPLPTVERIPEGDLVQLGLF